MTVNPHQVTADFERGLCDYTDAPYAVAVSSCTMAILIALAYHMPELQRRQRMALAAAPAGTDRTPVPPRIDCPARTYVGVPMSIMHAGGRPKFIDRQWKGSYQLDPTPVWDSARYMSSGMFYPGRMVCLSFHWSKTLGIQQGGAILHDNPDADGWLRRARFDGRTAGKPAGQDDVQQIGWHAYMSPAVAAEGLMRLSLLSRNNPPLENSDYPDLSKMEVFK